MSILEYLEQKRKELDLSARGGWRETIEDRARGTTRRMRDYCRSHGIDGIPDLNRRWKPPNVKYMGV